LEDPLIRVLLVEDNPGDVRLLREVLADVQGARFAMSHRPCLKDALQALGEEPFDVVLLDLSLPDAWGLDTLLQAHAHAPDVPIVVLTGLSDEALATRAVQEGAQDYLVKGQVDSDLLIRATRYAIERKRTEIEKLKLLEKTQEQAIQVQRILDTVQEGILTLDERRRLTLANPAAARYLDLLGGYRMGETLTHLGGRPLSMLLGPSADGLPHEVSVTGPPRRIFEIHVNAAPPDAEGGGWILLVRDVTEERQIQVSAQKQDRLAAVGQLASGIAHDFNNIMGAIILYAEMLLRSPGLQQKDQERLITVLQQAQRAAVLTRQILDFSRRAVMEPHRMDLVPFFDELQKLLARTLPETIRIELIHPPEEFVVSADPTRMQQVFMNLALNARDAMAEGGELRFEVDRIKLGPLDPPLFHNMLPGDWIRVRVTDTGVGISAEILPRIFEPFFTTKAPGEGSGLGLAQVYGIVKQHSGYVDVVSQVGVGTTFIIYLPSRSLPPDKVGSPERVSQAEGQRETLLVVEDEDATREAVCDFLQALNYRVLEAADGREALEVFERERDKIDLVLSDLVMPGMGGVTLYRKLRERYPGVRMVVMTGYPLGGGTRELLEQGKVIWIQKPMDSDTLAHAIRQALDEAPVLEELAHRSGAIVQGGPSDGNAGDGE